MRNELKIFNEIECENKRNNVGTDLYRYKLLHENYVKILTVARDEQDGKEETQSTTAMKGQGRDEFPFSRALLIARPNFEPVYQSGR